MFISDLVPDLVMEVPNLTDVQAMRFLQSSLRRFYSESLLWEFRRSFSVAEGGDVVRMTLPVEECSIIAIKRAYFEGVELPVMREDEYRRMTKMPAARNPLGYFPNLAGSSAFVVPAALVRQDNAYDFTLILAPTRDADELPLDAYSQFEDSYIAGALAKIYANQMFLNASLADYNEQRFQDGVIRAQNVRDNLYSGPAKEIVYGGL